MTDKHVEMKKRCIVQARLPADSGVDGPVTIRETPGSYLFFDPTIIVFSMDV